MNNQFTVTDLVWYSIAQQQEYRLLTQTKYDPFVNSSYYANTGGGPGSILISHFSAKWNDTQPATDALYQNAQTECTSNGSWRQGIKLNALHSLCSNVMEHSIEL